MERIRESRRGTPSSSSPGGGLSSSSSRRRSRGVSEVEDGGNDSTREQYNGREQGSSIRTRRRPTLNKSLLMDHQDEVADGSSDESSEDEFEEDYEPVRRRASRSESQLKGSEEMIGVSVPRKARSASTKRLQDSVSTLLPSNSSSSVQNSVAPGSSPSSSNASMKASKRTKPAPTKTRSSKMSKVSISESEVEVAQFLYGLTRFQSNQSPAKPDILQSSAQPDFGNNSSNEGFISAVSKASSPASTLVCMPSSSQSVLLPKHSITASTTAMGTERNTTKFASFPFEDGQNFIGQRNNVLKRKKPRRIQSEDSANPLKTACISKSSGCSILENSISSIPVFSLDGNDVDKDFNARKADISSPKPDKIVVPSDRGSSKPEASLPSSSSPHTTSTIHFQLEEKPSPSNLVQPKPLFSPEIDQHPTTISQNAEAETLDSNRQAPVDQANQMSQKESSSSMQDLPALSTLCVKLNAPDNASLVSAAAKSLKGVKFEIDLMALPENTFPDDMPDVADKRIHQRSDGGETICNGKSIVDFAEKMDIEDSKLKRDQDTPDLEKKIHTKLAAEATTMEKQLATGRKSVSQHDGSDLEKVGNKMQCQKNPKSNSRQVEQTGTPIGIITSTSTPIPVTIPGWPGGLSPIGYLGSSPANLFGAPSIQGAMSVEGNSVIPNAPFVMLPPARPGRCVTHWYITRLIRYRQQLAKLNPFWNAAGPLALYGTKPYNLNILPQSDALLFGGSVVRNPNLPPNGILGSGSIVSLNDYNSLKDKVPNVFTDAPKKQLSQQVHQGAAFAFPATQPRTEGTKHSSLSENDGLLSSSGAVTATSVSANTNISSLAATSDPQYLAMPHNNYPFPLPPAYGAHLIQQQQNLATPFNCSFFPSQLLQLQSQSLQQAQKAATYAGSSSQKHVQMQHCFPTSKLPLESGRNEPEHAGNCEGGAKSWVPLSQKNVQHHNIHGNPSFPPNFPVVVGKQHQPSSDPSLLMSFKGTTEVTGSVPLGQDMGSHHRYQPTDSTNQRKASSKAPVRSSSDKREPPHLPKQSMTRTKAPVSTISTANSSAGSMAHTDRIPVVYSNASAMSLPNIQSPQWNMLPSQTVNLSSLPVNSVSRKVTPPSTVLTQPMQTQSSTKAKRLSFANSEPRNQNSAVQAMIPGSMDVRRSVANQQAQPGSPVVQTVAATRSSYLPGSGKGPVCSPLSSSSVTVMAAASYAQAAANMPVKSAEQKPATA